MATQPGRQAGGCKRRIEYFRADYEASQAMGELALLPAVRAAADAAPIIADGFSCRHQIKDGAGREAMHVAVLLSKALG